MRRTRCAEFPVRESAQPLRDGAFVSLCHPEQQRAVGDMKDMRYRVRALRGRKKAGR